VIEKFQQISSKLIPQGNNNLKSFKKIQTFLHNPSPPIILAQNEYQDEYKKKHFASVQRP